LDKGKGQEKNELGRRNGDKVTTWTMERKRDKKFSIIFDGSVIHTVFYSTNSTGGHKGSFAIYVPFHVSTSTGSSTWRDIQKRIDITNSVTDMQV